MTSSICCSGFKLAREDVSVGFCADTLPVPEVVPEAFATAGVAEADAEAAPEAEAPEAAEAGGAVDDEVAAGDAGAVRAPEEVTEARSSSCFLIKPESN